MYDSFFQQELPLGEDIFVPVKVFWLRCFAGSSLVLSVVLASTAIFIQCVFCIYFCVNVRSQREEASFHWQKVYIPSHKRASDRECGVFADIKAIAVPKAAGLSGNFLIQSLSAISHLLSVFHPLRLLPRYSPLFCHPLILSLSLIFL